MFDLDLIKKYYENLSDKINKIKREINKPLTLSEKILYAHAGSQVKLFSRGKDYVDFYPDRVAMQDATAQMALLQFLVAGKNTVSVPTTVHADHLIQAKSGSEFDLATALKGFLCQPTSWEDIDALLLELDFEVVFLDFGALLANVVVGAITFFGL